MITYNSDNAIGRCIKKERLVATVRKELTMNLLRVITERNITILQLAMKSGVNPSDLYQALKGKIPFYPKWKRLIAEYLQMSEEELFGGDSDEV